MATTTNAIVLNEKKSSSQKPPFRMKINVKGVELEFETYPSSWLMVDENEDYQMSDADFLDALIDEWHLEEKNGFFNMLFEGNVLPDLWGEWTLEIIKNE